MRRDYELAVKEARGVLNQFHQFQLIVGTHTVLRLIENVQSVLLKVLLNYGKETLAMRFAM